MPKQDSRNQLWPPIPDHLDDYIISLRGEDWAHRTSVTPPTINESQESFPSAPVTTIFLLDFF
jgi:hypothetical protein